MKQSENTPNTGETAKVRIPRQLYVQVEERINLRRALSMGRDMITLQNMVRKTLEREGKNRGS